MKKLTLELTIEEYLDVVNAVNTCQMAGCPVTPGLATRLMEDLEKKRETEAEIFEQAIREHRAKSTKLRETLGYKPVENPNGSWITARRP